VFDTNKSNIESILV